MFSMLSISSIRASSLWLIAWLLAAPAWAADGLRDPDHPRDSVYQLDAPLVDQQGRATTLAAQRGRPLLVTMFYASCQHTCPLIVETVKAVRAKLAAQQREPIDVLMISLDPKRDTPAKLRELARQRSIDLQHWTLAQPRSADVRAIAALLGIRYRALAGGEFNHSSVLILLDADGRIKARTEQLAGVEPAFIGALQSELAATAARQSR